MGQTDQNSVAVIGRLTADSKYREYGENGKELSFSVANNRGYGDFAKVHFFNCKIHGKRATSLQQYMVKGQQVGLVGELAQDRWEDNEGHKRSVIYIEAHDTQLLGGNGNSNSQPNVNQEATTAPPAASSNDFEDDIPF